jgi:hypothetical protein
MPLPSRSSRSFPQRRRRGRPHPELYPSQFKRPRKPHNKHGEPDPAPHFLRPENGLQEDVPPSCTVPLYCLRRCVTLMKEHSQQTSLPRTRPIWWRTSLRVLLERALPNLQRSEPVAATERFPDSNALESGPLTARALARLDEAFDEVGQHRERHILRGVCSD